MVVFDVGVGIGAAGVACAAIRGHHGGGGQDGGGGGGMAIGVGHGHGHARGDNPSQIRKDGRMGRRGNAVEGQCSRSDQGGMGVEMTRWVMVVMMMVMVIARRCVEYGVSYPVPVYLILSLSILSCPCLSYPILSLSYLTLSYLILPLSLSGLSYPIYQSIYLSLPPPLSTPPLYTQLIAIRGPCGGLAVQGDRRWRMEEDGGTRNMCNR